MGKELVRKNIIDKSKVADDVRIKFDGTGKVYSISFTLKRPKEKVNQIKQRLNILRVLRENLGYLAYQSKNLFLEKDWIRIERLGYTKYLADSVMDIIFTTEKVEISIFNENLYNKNGDFEEVLKDYDNYKKTIEL